MLTAKQEMFVQELIKGKSQREAYKQAGYKTDTMTDAVIDIRACELFKHSKVKVRYEELHSRLVKEAEDECIVNAKEVLKELKHIAFDDIRNYLSFRTEKKLIGYDDGQPIYEYKQVVEMKDSDSIDTRNISEVQLTKDGFKFKQYCKDTALVNLMKHLGMFVERVESKSEVVNKHEYHIEQTIQTDPETAELLKQLHKRSTIQTMGDPSKT